MSVATISMQDFCAAIYCALADSEAVPDVAEGTVVIAARSGESSPRDLLLEFFRVQDYSRRTERPQPESPRGPEDRVELSAVELEGEPGHWRVWLNPWYLEEIDFRCSSIRLNGLEVVGQGRWLQDELPTSSPRLPTISRGAV